MFKSYQKTSILPSDIIGGKGHITMKQPKTLTEQISVQQIIKMFDLLPDMLFWIKDVDSKIVHANQCLLEQVGIKSLDQLTGQTDLDFAPTRLAKQYIADDKKVMAGQIIDNRLEINLLHSGDFAWFSTSKRPLFDSQNNVIGTYGISRSLGKGSLALSGMNALKIPVDYIRQNYMLDISLRQLADVSHLSVSALERRFNKYMAKTPKQFINEVRLEKARRLLLETDLPIAQIASETGFSDHSYFSQKFNLMFDELPSSIRKNRMNQASSI